MQRRITLGKVFGIGLDIDASWFVILALVTWTLSSGYFPSAVPGLLPSTYWMFGFAGALLLFTCVLLHEMGHSLVAKLFGIPVNRITLFIFGGVAEINREPRRAVVELAIAAAGPAVSVSLAAFFIYASRVIPIETQHQAMAYIMLKHLGFVNAALFMFNLLPGFPLDGGRMVRAMMWAWSGDFIKSTRTASVLGNIIGIGLVIIGFLHIGQRALISGLWYIALGIFLRDAARAAYHAAILRRLHER
jgi:Zn-dependent protease